MKQLEKEAKRLAFEEKKRELASLKESIQEKQRQELLLKQIEQKELAEKAKRASRIGFSELDPYSLPDPLPSRPGPALPKEATVSKSSPPPPPKKLDFDEILGGLPSAGLRQRSNQSALLERARLLNPLSKPGGSTDKDQPPPPPPQPPAPDPADVAEAQQAERLKALRERHDRDREVALRVRSETEAQKRDLMMRQIFGDF